MQHQSNQKDATISDTRKLSASNVNIRNGCNNGHRLYYAKGMRARVGNEIATSWKKSEVSRPAAEKMYRRHGALIRFPASREITPNTLNQCLPALTKLLKAGRQVMIGNKPNPECTRALCTELAEFKDQMMFRFVIGSANSAVLDFWEWGAPSFEQRIEALQIARERGFSTSVACTPMLDNAVEAVVERVIPLVTTSIWIDLPDRLKTSISLCGGDAETWTRADNLKASFTEERVLELYGKYKDNPKIKWGKPIKRVIGIRFPVSGRGKTQ